ncbi:MAG: ADP-ribosyltransferase domain-containing protein, partial [Nitrososphaeraceae archaeon]|nr:ADP-ribosyltransferase domain-containing protein [Nitrososphaeraceae archaeon]
CTFDPDVYTINNIVEWNAFSMCSSEFRTASDLIKQNRGVVFVIQSLSGRKIEKFSKNPAECEVVFLPGTQFRVKAYYKANIVCLGQKNIRVSTFKIADKDIERALKGECIIIELEEVDKSMLAIKLNINLFIISI